MKPTSAHLILWLERNKPAWAKDLQIPARASVDEIINRRAGIKWSNQLHNALNLLDLVRRNMRKGLNREYKDIIDYLSRFDGKSAATSCQRDAIFHRWGRNGRKAQKRLTNTLK